MQSIVVFILLVYFKIVASNKTIEHNTFVKIVDKLSNALGVNKNEKINTLNEKIQTIDKYTINKDIYEEILKNETIDTNFNATNFYESLSENEYLGYLTKNETKSLYLKMKERMNRDDIMKIISDRSNISKLAKTARKMMDANYLEHLNKKNALDIVVDEMIAEKSKDKHKYGNKTIENIYWDPQGELEDLNAYHQHDARRLYRGERTTIRYYPFMVSVHVMSRFWCGGVLYWHDLVLTSAACLQLVHNNRFFRENPRVLQVRIGSNYSRVGGEMVDALEVYFYPSYNPKTLRNNIAVIRLRKHLYFNYHRIPKIIDISHYKDGVPPTAEVLLLGWGVTKSSQKMAYEPVYLQRKFLPIYPNVFCKEVYGEKFHPQTMFCAGTLTTGEGACDHDAGGPAVLAGKLVGIISFGSSLCGRANMPTVFTLVGAYADWIESVNNSMPGYYQGKQRTTKLTSRTKRWSNYQYVSTTQKITPFITFSVTNEPVFRNKESEET